MDILKMHGIKKTLGRISIINIIRDKNRPLSENEIKAEMGEFYDRITFYRNIQTFIQVGIIHKIVVDNTIVKYGLNDCEKGHFHHNLHAHFYCERCHAVICMKDICIPQFDLPKGFQIEDCDIIIRGKCQKCSKE